MFRQIDSEFSASPQISLDDVARAAEMGFSMIINNRPDGEEPDAPQGDAIAAAAAQHDLSYVYIPVTHAGFSHFQVETMGAALQRAQGPVLAYCRSGTRSTLLWALTVVKDGRPVEEVTRLAAAQGYDLSPIRPMLDGLAASR